LTSFLDLLARQPDMLYSPSQEDFRKLADELEANPPSHLDEEELRVVLQLLRGEEQLPPGDQPPSLPEP